MGFWGFGVLGGRSLLTDRRPARASSPCVGERVVVGTARVHLHRNRSAGATVAGLADTDEMVGGGGVRPANAVKAKTWASTMLRISNSRSVLLIRMQESDPQHGESQCKSACRTMPAYAKGSSAAGSLRSPAIRRSRVRPFLRRCVRSACAILE